MTNLKLVMQQVLVGIGQQLEGLNASVGNLEIDQVHICSRPEEYAQKTRGLGYDFSTVDEN